MLGKRLFDTWIGNGSISLAHIGSMPLRWADSGKAEIPSKREPSLRLVTSLAPFCAQQPQLGP